MADEKLWDQSCFNPFKLEVHAKNDRKQLRRVTQSYLMKLNIPITPTTSEYLICHACRIRVTRISDPGDISGRITPIATSPGNLKHVAMAGTSSVRSTVSDLKFSLIPVRRESITNYNESSITLGESPTIKRTSSIWDHSSKEKFRKIYKTNVDEKASEIKDDNKRHGNNRGNHTLRLPYTFRGHVVPVLTPFRDNSTRSPNLSIIPQYAEFLADRGVTGVLVNGTSGEGPAMNVEERKSVAETWARAVKSTKQHLMIQVGGAPLPDVLELAKHAESLGVDSLLCLPELYFKPSTPKQLVEYLRLVGQAAPKTPLLYYHIPIFSNVNINMPQFLEAVGERIPSFVGIKFTSTNLEEGMQAVRVNNKEFVVFLGSDQIMAGAFALGMDSAIGTTVNMFPELAIEILKAGTSGDAARAREAQEKLSKATAAIAKYGHWVETMKVAMALLTPFDLGPPRSPLTPLSTESVNSMKEGLRALGYQVLR